jgi:hypothetical protein
MHNVHVKWERIYQRAAELVWIKVEIMLTVGERVGANKEGRDDRPESGKLDGF